MYKRLMTLMFFSFLALLPWSFSFGQCEGVEVEGNLYVSTYDVWDSWVIEVEMTVWATDSAKFRFYFDEAGTNIITYHELEVLPNTHTDISFFYGPNFDNGFWEEMWMIDQVSGCKQYIDFACGYELNCAACNVFGTNVTNNQLGTITADSSFIEASVGETITVGINDSFINEGYGLVYLIGTFQEAIYTKSGFHFRDIAHSEVGLFSPSIQTQIEPNKTYLIAPCIYRDVNLNGIYDIGDRLCRQEALTDPQLTEGNFVSVYFDDPAYVPFSAEIRFECNLLDTCNMVNIWNRYINIYIDSLKGGTTEGNSFYQVEYNFKYNCPLYSEYGDLRDSLSIYKEEKIASFENSGLLEGDVSCSPFVLDISVRDANGVEVFFEYVFQYGISFSNLLDCSNYEDDVYIYLGMPLDEDTLEVCRGDTLNIQAECSYVSSYDWSGPGAGPILDWVPNIKSTYILHSGNIGESLFPLWGELSWDVENEHIYAISYNGLFTEEDFEGHYNETLYASAIVCYGYYWAETWEVIDSFGRVPVIYYKDYDAIVELKEPSKEFLDCDKEVVVTHYPIEITMEVVNDSKDYNYSMYFDFDSQTDSVITGVLSADTLIQLQFLFSDTNNQTLNYGPMTVDVEIEEGICESFVIDDYLLQNIDTIESLYMRMPEQLMSFCRGDSIKIKAACFYPITATDGSLIHRRYSITDTLPNLSEMSNKEQVRWVLDNDILINEQGVFDTDVGNLTNHIGDTLHIWGLLSNDSVNSLPTYYVNNIERWHVSENATPIIIYDSEYIDTSLACYMIMPDPDTLPTFCKEDLIQITASCFSNGNIEVNQNCDYTYVLLDFQPNLSPLPNEDGFELFQQAISYSEEGVFSTDLLNSYKGDTLYVVGLTSIQSDTSGNNDHIPDLSEIWQVSPNASPFVYEPIPYQIEVDISESLEFDLIDCETEVVVSYREASIFINLLDETQTYDYSIGQWNVDLDSIFYIKDSGLIYSDTTLFVILTDTSNSNFIPYQLVVTLEQYCQDSIFTIQAGYSSGTYGPFAITMPVDLQVHCEPSNFQVQANCFYPNWIEEDSSYKYTYILLDSLPHSYIQGLFIDGVTLFEQALAYNEEGLFSVEGFPEYIDSGDTLFVLGLISLEPELSDGDNIPELGEFWRISENATPVLLNTYNNNETDFFLSDALSLCEQESNCIQLLVSALAATAGASYEWTPTTGLNNPNIPNPIACVDTTTTYHLSVTSPSGCSRTDSITVYFEEVLESLVSINEGEDSLLVCDSSFSLQASEDFESYLWSNGATTSTLNLTYTQDQYYSLSAWDANACRHDASIWVYKEGGCVYPGDANANGIVDNEDVLSIGVAYGTMGNVRPNANIEWLGQACPNWNETFADTTNYKHADCNGDGIIEATDVEVVDYNYGNVVNKAETSHSATGIPLYIDLSMIDTLYGGASLEVPIILGTIDSPAVEIYGIAFSIEYDPSLIQDSLVEVTFDTCWLGDLGEDLLSFVKYFPNEGRIDIALTRIDQINSTGYGEIGLVSAILIDNVEGKDEVELDFPISITNVRLIDTYETVIPVSISMASFTFIPTGTHNAPLNAVEYMVYPNPSKDRLFISIDNAAQIKSVQLLDVNGKAVYTDDGIQTSIDVSHLNAGIYILSIEPQDVSYPKMTRKIYIQ